MVKGPNPKPDYGVETRLERVFDAASPDPAFAARLERQLLGLADQNSRSAVTHRRFSWRAISQLGLGLIGLAFLVTIIDLIINFLPQDTLAPVVTATSIAERSSSIPTGGHAATQSSPLFKSALEILNIASAPQIQSTGVVYHVQQVYEEAEGLPPDSEQLQFLRATTDWWFESAGPWRYRVTKIYANIGLAYDGLWDGEHLWTLDAEDNPHYAVVRVPGSDEIPSGPIDPAVFVKPANELLDQAKYAPDHLRYVGTEEIEPWGLVNVIAYDWDGSTAPTVKYAGFPHTIFFKITQDQNWLVEWSDVIHTEAGDVVHRRSVLTAWETIEPSYVKASVWTFNLPVGVELLDTLPTPTLSAVQAGRPKRMLLGWEVLDLGYTPLAPGYLPEGWELKEVKTTDLGDHYTLYYESANRLIRIESGPGIGYGWANQPEVVDLSWATVEMAQNEPMGPPGWIVVVKPNQTKGENLPNVLMDVQIEDRTEVLKIADSLTPADQPKTPERTPFPSGSDPAHSDLIMKMIKVDSSDTPTFFHGDLYAYGPAPGDSDLLGRVDFGSVPGGWCDRSADGSRLAFNYIVSPDDHPISATLRWLDLRDVTVVYDPLPQLDLISPVTWSPTDGRLAFFACRVRQVDCGLYVFNVDNGQIQLVTDIGVNPAPAVWNPDGQELAFILSTGEQVTLYVVRADNGEVLYARQINFPDTSGTPLEVWGVSLPEGLTGFSRCAQAP